MTEDRKDEIGEDSQRDAELDEQELLSILDDWLIEGEYNV